MVELCRPQNEPFSQEWELSQREAAGTLSPVKYTQCHAGSVDHIVMSHIANDLFLLAQKNALSFASLENEPEKIYTQPHLTLMYKICPLWMRISITWSASTYTISVSIPNTERQNSGKVLPLGFAICLTETHTCPEREKQLCLHSTFCLFHLLTLHMRTWGN